MAEDFADFPSCLTKSQTKEIYTPIHNKTTEHQSQDTVFKWSQQNKLENSKTE